MCVISVLFNTKDLDLCYVIFVLFNIKERDF
jgi:hypothetical protein